MATSRAGTWPCKPRFIAATLARVLNPEPQTVPPPPPETQTPPRVRASGPLRELQCPAPFPGVAVDATPPATVGFTTPAAG
jgi:hypothetical protein